MAFFELIWDICLLYVEFFKLVNFKGEPVTSNWSLMTINFFTLKIFSISRSLWQNMKFLQYNDSILRLWVGTYLLSWRTANLPLVSVQCYLPARTEKANLIMFCQFCLVYATNFTVVCYRWYIAAVRSNISCSIMLVTCPVIQYLCLIFYLTCNKLSFVFWENHIRVFQSNIKSHVMVDFKVHIGHNWFEASTKNLHVMFGVQHWGDAC